MDHADLQDQNKLFEMVLSNSGVSNPMVLPMAALGAFRIREGEHEYFFQATDEVGQYWSFRLFIRRGDPNPRPGLGWEWPGFARAKSLKAGDKIEMYRLQQSDGDKVTYKIKAYTKLFKAWLPIKRY